MSQQRRSGRIVRRLVPCAVLLGVLSLGPTGALAAQGDCAQPLSNGTSPVSTDCLFILNAAVSLVTCTPVCICVPSGSLPVSATDALVCLRKAVGQVVPLNCPCGSGGSTSTTSSTRLDTTTTLLVADTTTTTVAPLTSSAAAATCETP